MNKRITVRVACLAVLTTALLAASAQAQKSKGHGAAAGDFYIISSVDQANHRFILKLPTEVTMQMLLNDKTVYLDENGKAIHLADLRAGDTVFIEHTRGPSGEIAVRIRKGEMTLEELHRRYVKFPAAGA